MPRPGVFVRYRKDMEYAIGFQNVCIFNFGNHIDINIKCTVEKYSVTSQSIRIYNGRNLLCACKIGDEGHNNLDEKWKKIQKQFYNLHCKQRWENRDPKLNAAIYSKCLRLECKQNFHSK